MPNDDTRSEHHGATPRKANVTRATCHADRTLPVRRIQGFGWKRDLPDAADYKFDARAAARARGTKLAAKLPTKVDLRTSGYTPGVYDQGDLGSCTANAIGGAYEYEQKRQGLVDFMPARLFIYYNERVMEGSVNDDSGAMIRDGMKSIAKLGVPHESLWPYNTARFRDKPSSDVYADALAHQCITYAKVGQTETQVKQALASGTPVVFGFSVYESFEDTGSDGIVVPDQGQIIGGHAVCIWGYETIKRKLYAIVRNSWGNSWADDGYCYFPMSFLMKAANADDFWAIQSVEGTK